MTNEQRGPVAPPPGVGVKDAWAGVVAAYRDKPAVPGWELVAGAFDAQGRPGHAIGVTIEALSALLGAGARLDEATPGPEGLSIGVAGLGMHLALDTSPRYDGRQGGAIATRNLGEVWGELRAEVAPGVVEARKAMAAGATEAVAAGCGLEEALGAGWARAAELVGDDPALMSAALVGLGLTLRAIAPLASVVDAMTDGAGPQAWEDLPAPMRQAVAP